MARLATPAPHRPARAPGPGEGRRGARPHGVGRPLGRAQPRQGPPVLGAPPRRRRGVRGREGQPDRAAAPEHRLGVGRRVVVAQHLQRLTRGEQRPPSRAPGRTRSSACSTWSCERRGTLFGTLLARRARRLSAGATQAAADQDRAARRPRRHAAARVALRRGARARDQAPGRRAGASSAPGPPSATTPRPRAPTSRRRSPPPARRSGCSCAGWPRPRSPWPSGAPATSRTSSRSWARRRRAGASCWRCASWA